METKLPPRPEYEDFLDVPVLAERLLGGIFKAAAKSVKATHKEQAKKEVEDATREKFRLRQRKKDALRRKWKLAQGKKALADVAGDGDDGSTRERYGEDGYDVEYAHEDDAGTMAKGGGEGFPVCTPHDPNARTCTCPICPLPPLPSILETIDYPDYDELPIEGELGEDGTPEPRTPPFYKQDGTVLSSAQRSNEPEEEDSVVEAPYVPVEPYIDPSDVSWPTIGSFDVHRMLEELELYLSTWKINLDWKFTIDIVSEKESQCDDVYVYEAIWSIPTPAYPVPQATASVYFTVLVSRIIPDNLPVKVSYVFEGLSYQFKPTSLNNFQENHLIDIINSKINVFKSLTF